MELSKIKNITFSILGGLALGFAPIAYAGNTGSITISGSIPASTAITVSAATGSNTLELTATQTDLNVASIQETSNTPSGYKVTLSSTNNGVMKNGTLGSITYTAKYGGAAVNLTGSGTQVTSTGNTTSTTNVTKALTISYTGQTATALMAGTYSDTLTFTIAAN